MTDKLISIIMPAYNAAEFIAESIRSAQAQTYMHWELIVVDDGSTDDTASVVKELSALDPRIKYHYQKNQRLGAARNTGLRSATGEWIAFLDSDDLWEPEKLEMQINAANEHNADVVFTRGLILWNETQTRSPYESVYGRFDGKKIYNILNLRNVIPVLSVMMRASLVQTIGPQDTDPKAYGCEDWDYWLRISKSGATFYGIDRSLFHYRIHNNGMSQNRLRMQLSECYVIYKNLDRSLIDQNETRHVNKHLLQLVKNIVPQLYGTTQAHLIPYYLDIASSVTSGLQVRLAKQAYDLLKDNSRSLVIFFLFEYSTRALLYLPRKVRGIKRKLDNYLRPSFTSKFINAFGNSEYINIDKSLHINEPFVFNGDKEKARIKIDKNVHFRSFCHILVNESASLNIGNNVFFNNFCSINCFSSIDIGENTLIGEGVKMYDHNHRFEVIDNTLLVERNKFKSEAIKIGNNCWIGSNVVILKGVTIGDNVIIGAGNVIYKSIPANSIVKGKFEQLSSVI